VAAEEIVQELDGLRGDLLDLNARDVDRLPGVTANPLGVVASVNANVTVRINHAGRVGQIGGTR
jgi:hypothetical protein